MAEIENLLQHGERQVLDNMEKATPSGKQPVATETVTPPIAPEQPGAIPPEFDPSMIDDALAEEAPIPFDPKEPKAVQDARMRLTAWGNMVSFLGASPKLYGYFEDAKQDYEEAMDEYKNGGLSKEQDTGQNTEQDTEQKTEAGNEGNNSELLSVMKEIRDELKGKKEANDNA